MLRRIDIERGRRVSEAELRPAGTGIDAEVMGVAQRIIDEVRARGDAAVREFTEQLDHVVLGDLRVSEAEIEQAVASVDERFRRAISEAAWAIEDFHRRQVQQSWFTTGEDGIVLGQLVNPIRRVGIYVPGGRARYPSSVLMNAIPAVVAGVEEIAMVVPPAPDGSVDAYTLAAAAEAGITEIYKIGGAQAIAALAYGTESVPRVDKITGPGNAYVTAAKKLVMGEVGIDMLAGPSEVLIVADETAEPLLVAIDLMAQAEHDPRAATFLVTTDPDLPDAVEEAIRELLSDSPRAEVIVRALQDNGVAVVCPDIDVALDVANEIAPEHLELQVESPFELLGRIRNAGAVFLGPWTPESVGDYVAGPNHVLPTGGTARFSSPLSVDDFIKKTSVISYTLEGLYADGATVMEIASAEGLAAHAGAVGLRLALAEHFFEQEEDGDEEDA
ncbi:histidinol dehydrogenase [Coriobacteriia bacterium Es71-Z0120]|uniref:histidinol dehydrogenase n=1 Tax=Parvivirga hydrogeniphila TaxID=2939460 RepID=UPI00226082A2|nr:histidinol dehydrogenase [Parvivirga hydrogeniphila]MCL4078723.1 histidinol dehydrogenase [Parvivirga hydrogeniphila]